MVRILKVALLIIFGGAALYALFFLAVVPLVTETKGLPKLLALNAYDVLYRPVKKVLPYRNVVRTYWLKYERHWCAENALCEIYGHEAKGGGLFKAE